MNNDHDEQDLSPYADEPIADEEWLAKYSVSAYYKEDSMEVKKCVNGELDVVLLNHGFHYLFIWMTFHLLYNERCSCGNCNVQLLQNAKEC